MFDEWKINIWLPPPSSSIFCVPKRVSRETGAAFWFLTAENFPIFPQLFLKVVLQQKRLFVPYPKATSCGLQPNKGKPSTCLPCGPQTKWKAGGRWWAQKLIETDTCPLIREVAVSNFRCSFSIYITDLFVVEIGPKPWRWSCFAPKPSLPISYWPLLKQKK